MKKKTLSILYSMLIFFVMFIIIHYIVKMVFRDLNTGLLGAIVAVITRILAPNMNEIEIQSGKKYQLKWIFSKRVITID